MSKYSTQTLIASLTLLVLLAWSKSNVVGQQECLDVAQVLLQCSSYMLRDGAGAVESLTSPSLMCCNDLQGLSFVGAIGDSHRICKCMEAMIPSMGDLDSAHVGDLFNKCDSPFQFNLSPISGATCP